MVSIYLTSVQPYDFKKLLEDAVNDENPPLNSAGKIGLEKKTMISLDKLGILGRQTFAGEDYDENPDDEERFPSPQWK